MTQKLYYHGGAPDLKEILPPDKSGAKSTADFGARGVCRTDKVYVTTNSEMALVFAALHPSHRGTVYVVKPYGKIERDPDCSEDGLSYQCDGAEVIEARQVEFHLMKSIQREFLGG